MITNKYTNLVEDFNTSVSVIDRTASKDILVRMWKTGTNVTKQDPLGPSWRKTPDHVFHLPLVCRETLASQNFPKSQQVNLIRKLRKNRKKGNCPTRQNYNQSQLSKVKGFQFLLKVYRQYFEPCPLNYFADIEIPTGQKKLTIYCIQGGRPQTGWNQRVDEVDS